MHGFKHGAQFAYVGARNQTEAANQSGAEIRHDVAVEVLEQHDVKLFGAHNQLHAGIVNNLVVGFDFRVVGGHLAEAIEKKAIRHLHDVGLMNGSHLLALFHAGIFEGEPSYSSRRFLSNDLYTLDHARNDFVFDT